MVCCLNNCGDKYLMVECILCFVPSTAMEAPVHFRGFSYENILRWFMGWGDLFTDRLFPAHWRLMFGKSAQIPYRVPDSCHPLKNEISAFWIFARQLSMMGCIEDKPCCLATCLLGSLSEIDWCLPPSIVVMKSLGARKCTICLKLVCRLGCVTEAL